MNAQSRRKIEMGTRALEFSRAHPDTEPGTAAAVAKLEQLVARANEVAAAQRDGLIHARAAEAHQEVLAKHGLSASVLEQFGQMLDQFDTAVALGNDGRTAHVGATRELRAVAQEIARTVRVMDGRNRQRFAEDGQLLGSWIGASRVLGGRRAGTVGGPAVADGEAPAGGEVRPAA
jgi:hypothetical protein